MCVELGVKCGIIASLLNEVFFGKINFNLSFIWCNNILLKKNFIHKSVLDLTLYIWYTILDGSNILSMYHI